MDSRTILTHYMGFYIRAIRRPLQEIAQGLAFRLGSRELYWILAKMGEFTELHASTIQDRHFDCPDRTLN